MGKSYIFTVLKKKYKFGFLSQKITCPVAKIIISLETTEYYKLTDNLFIYLLL
jgi:hypothetical protein